jgi:23S rRNA pseudouridine2605 synthase
VIFAHDLLSEIPVRLDRYLREATLGSLESARALCTSERVRLSCVPILGVVEQPPLQQSPFPWETLVFPGDRVFVDDVSCSRRTAHHSLVLHKPTEVTSSLRDPDSDSDLSRFVSQMPEGVFPVGRLDRMTSGLLLFTTDSDLSNALLSPSFHVPRTYRATVLGHVTPDDPRLRGMVEGVVWPGHLGAMRAVRATACPPRDVTVTASLPSSVHATPPTRTVPCTDLVLVLEEGKKREVRRLCRASGMKLVALHRSHYGPVGVESLLPGAVRPLEPEEVERLWQVVGGRGEVRRQRVEALVDTARRARERNRPLPRLESWLNSEA